MSKLNFITMMCSWVQTEHHINSVTVSPGDRVEETQVIEGRVEDITSYEISLLKPESVSI